MNRLQSLPAYAWLATAVRLVRKEPVWKLELGALWSLDVEAWCFEKDFQPQFCDARYPATGPSVLRISNSEWPSTR
jgi:hypothetical protein